MKEHRDTIQHLSIVLDENAQNFTVYADGLENKFNAWPIQKLADYDMRFWAYDLDGAVRKRMKDDPPSQGLRRTRKDKSGKEKKVGSRYG